VRLKALTTNGRLPFVFEASGSQTHFTNGYDPDPRARTIFAFPRPETLARHIHDAETNPTASTWRAKVRRLPPLVEQGLRDAQIVAVRAVERSLAEARFSRSLVQMATGAGKTFMAITSIHRLRKYGGFTRVLFLVDRKTLADQALGEFMDYQTQDDSRLFTEPHTADKLTAAGGQRSFGSTICVRTSISL
jgi:type I restriction enzyme R subunit